jgi:hypothetical protein
MVYVFSAEGVRAFPAIAQRQPGGIGGYFWRNVDTNTIAFSTEGFADEAAVVFHEYSHLLVGTAVRSIPIWLNEGLAEYYSTFSLKSGGKGANIGLAIPRHVQLLRQRFIPLSQLLAVDQSSELYNEGERRSIFYAESWALTHYLMTELPSPDLINQHERDCRRRAADQAFAARCGSRQPFNQVPRICPRPDVPRPVFVRRTPAAAAPMAARCWRRRKPRRGSDSSFASSDRRRRQADRERGHGAGQRPPSWSWRDCGSRRTGPTKRGRRSRPR